MQDTFTISALRALNNSRESYLKYIKGEILTPYNDEIEKGNTLHGLICAYLKGFEITKFLAAINKEDYEIFEKIKESNIIKLAESCEKKYIEYPFFVKDCAKKPFYLTGRFDAVIKSKDKYTILDWKTKNLPKSPNSDLQTVLYIYCASKLFKTKNIEMIYHSLTKNESIKCFYDENYRNTILEIVNKL